MKLDDKYYAEALDVIRKANEYHAHHGADEVAALVVTIAWALHDAERRGGDTGN